MIHLPGPPRTIRARQACKIRQLADEAGSWHYEAYEARQRIETLERELADAHVNLEVLSRELATSQEVYYARMRDFVLDGTLKENQRLTSELARRPQTASVTMPAKEISLKRSPLQQEIVRLIGSTGLGRVWRIADQVLATGEASSRNSVSNAVSKLKGLGLVDDYRRDGRAVRFAIAALGSLEAVARQFGISEKGVRLALNRAGVFERGAFRRTLQPPAAAYVPPGAARLTKAHHSCAACEWYDWCKASVGRGGEIACELQEVRQ